MYVTKDEFKEMFKSICGPQRKMADLAADISKTKPISASSLYRISNLNIKIALKEDFVEALIRNRDPACEYTPDEIRAKCCSIGNMTRNKKYENKERFARVSKNAIIDASFRTDIWVQGIEFPDILSKDATYRYSTLFNMCLAMGKTNDVPQHIYITVLNGDLIRNASEVFYDYLGHAVLLDKREDDHHVLMFTADKNGQELISQIKQFPEIKNGAVNLSAVVIPNAKLVNPKAQSFNLCGSESLLVFKS